MAEFATGAPDRDDETRATRTSTSVGYSFTLPGESHFFRSFFGHGTSQFHGTMTTNEVAIRDDD